MNEWFFSFWPVTSTHWLILCLVLLAIVAATQIFDFFWLAVASGVVAALMSLYPGSSGLVQSIVFFGSSVILIAMGRIIGTRLQLGTATHPNLNHRSRQLIGRRGTALRGFENGFGELRVGDSQWRARCDEGEVAEGCELEIVNAEGALLIVRPREV